MGSTKILFIFVATCILVLQGQCQKTGKTPADKSAKSGSKTVNIQQTTAERHSTHHVGEEPLGQQSAVPQVRQCRCDELDQCIRDQATHYNDLTSRCRHGCGLAFLTNDTAEYVANCYDAFERSKRDQKTNKHRCLENMTSKPCLTDNQQEQPSQATVTVDPTKIVHHHTKRNIKTLLPPNINLYASCVKTCRKNGGVVHFNPDGTPAKTAKTPVLTINTPTADAMRANVAQKPGKGYAACAVKLNCQLIPVDKTLEKQVKQLCKYQAAHTEDNELTLCTCLEGALKQDFQCEPPLTSETEPHTCSASSSQSGETASCQQKKQPQAK